MRTARVCRGVCVCVCCLRRRRHCRGCARQATWNGAAVAVKKLRGGTALDLERFRSELRLLASFRHDNILPVLGKSGTEREGGGGSW